MTVKRGLRGQAVADKARDPLGHLSASADSKARAGKAPQRRIWHGGDLGVNVDTRPLPGRGDVYSAQYPHRTAVHLGISLERANCAGPTAMRHHLEHAGVALNSLHMPSASGEPASTLPPMLRMCEVSLLTCR